MLRNDALDSNLQLELDEFWPNVAGGQPGLFAVVVKFQFAVCCQIACLIVVLPLVELP